VTDRRRKIFADPVACRLLGSILRRRQDRWPFAIDAIVLLPDHLHAIWSLPPGDADFSQRWVRAGVSPPDWACVNRQPQPLTFSDIAGTIGESNKSCPVAGSAANGEAEEV